MLKEKNSKLYWLMKTEPDAFSIDDLIAAPKQTACWDGVRNYQARNFMRDQFAPGQKVLIYHSRTTEPAVVGLAEVASGPYADHTALNSDSKYYDEKSAKLGASRWWMVDVRALQKFKTPVTLQQCRSIAALRDMELLKKGQRLSIQPVTEKEFALICKLGL